MNTSKISRKLAVCLASTFALLSLSSETGYCQKSALYTRGNWQTSLDPANWVEGKPYAYTASGSIKIGVRDKFGVVGRYSATFVVTDPNNNAYKKLVKVAGDDWGYATFPDNFNTSALRPGNYSVKIYVKNQLVVAFKVNYRP
jgi:hypothetical protein